MHRHKWILKQVKVAIVREIEIPDSLKFILKIIWEKEMSMGEGVCLGRRSFKDCVLSLKAGGIWKWEVWSLEPKRWKRTWIFGRLYGAGRDEETQKSGATHTDREVRTPILLFLWSWSCWTSGTGLRSEATIYMAYMPNFCGFKLFDNFKVLFFCGKITEL